MYSSSSDHHLLHRVMSLYCGLFLLLAAHCGATEYYIKPTVPLDTSCPGQPCLTLNQYTNDSSYSIRSNTVFTFLPGEHVMERPLEIKYVSNVTLRASSEESGVYLQLASHFSCEAYNHCISVYKWYHYDSAHINLRKLKVCCSAVRLINVLDVEISLGITTVNVPGVVVEQSANIHFKKLAINSIPNSLDTHESSIGIVSYNSRHLYVDSLQASNLSYGILLQITHHTTITGSVIKNNQNSGLCMFKTHDTIVTNTTLSGNMQCGMKCFSCTNTNMMNVSIINNKPHGIVLYSSNDTNMTEISVMKNEGDGLYLFKCHNNNMVNILSSFNKGSGVSLQSCDNITMRNISATNQYEGVDLGDCRNAIMEMISARRNLMGILLFDNINMSLINISAIDNEEDGMYIESCEDIIMTTITATNNQIGGIRKHRCINTTLTHVNVTYNQKGGILILLSSIVTIKDIVSLNYNGNIGISFSQCTFQIQLEDCKFSNVASLPTLSSGTKPHNVPAVVGLNSSTLTMSNCTFTWNSITSIRAIRDSEIIVDGEIIISENRALLGAAFVLFSSSIILYEAGRVTFQNNHALDYGGAIYIMTEEIYGRSKSMTDIVFGGRPSVFTTSTKCFISVEGTRAQTRLTFVNNTASKGGDVVYGGLIALGYDGDWNCLLSFKNVSDMSLQNPLSLITSAPSRVCLCHNGHFVQPNDCLTVTEPTIHVYPGQTITLPAVVVGQDFGTVTGFVIAKFYSSPYTVHVDLEQGQQSILVSSSKCTNLNYTLYSGEENGTAVLMLQTDNADILQPMSSDYNHKVQQSWTILNGEPNYRKLALEILSDSIEIREDNYIITTNNYSEMINHTIENFIKFSPGTTFGGWDAKFVFSEEIYSYPVLINISFHSCPLGFSLTRNPPFKCDCNPILQLMPQVSCDIQHQAITRRGLMWVGTYANDIMAVSRYCPYNYCKSTETTLTLNHEPQSNSEYSNHSNTDSQCDYKHVGILCGGCQPGLSLVLGSDRCQPCSNVYLSLLLPFALAGVFLVFFIKVLDFTISQGTLNTLVFYVNVVKANQYIYFDQTSINPMTLFIAWFNLDIGIETCFFNGLTAYSRTWLQFVFPIYIWAIAGGIIIIAKYNGRVARVMGNNSVPVLATLFFLSYAKLFNTIITALLYTTLYTTHGRQLVWSADGNLDYLGPKHAALFTVALAALLFLWLPYTLLLLLGQWLHRLNFHLVTCLLLKLKPFLDAHYAAFNDKHRYWFGVLLLARCVTLSSIFLHGEEAKTVMFSLSILCMLMMFVVYRKKIIQAFDTALFVNLAILNIADFFANGSNKDIISFTLIAIALAQFVGLVLYKIILIFKCGEKVMVCVSRKEHSDDWELYEEAALLRETVSDSDSDTEADMGSNVSASIESLPTYGL